MSQAITRTRPPEAKRTARAAKRAARRPGAAEREALAERLRCKAAQADDGGWISLAGLSDEELVAALTCR